MIFIFDHNINLKNMLRGYSVIFYVGVGEGVCVCVCVSGRGGGLGR